MKTRWLSGLLALVLALALLPGRARADRDPDGDLRICGRSVSFDASFTVRYLLEKEVFDVYFSEGMTVRSFTVTVNGEARDLSAFRQNGVFCAGEREYYWVKVGGIAAKDIDTPLSFELVCEYDGETYTDSYTDSVLAALQAASGNFDLADAANAAIACCAAAATVFGKDASAFVFSPVEHVCSYTPIGNVRQGTGAIRICGTSLVLKDETAIRFWADPGEYRGDPQDLTLLINGREAAAVPARNGRYFTFRVPVSLNEMKTPMTAQLYAGEVPVSDRYTDSVLNYALTLADEGAGFDAERRALGQALVDYVHYGNLFLEKRGEWERSAPPENELTPILDRSRVAGSPVSYAAADRPLLPEQFAAIPVANASMTADELRQICVDYVCLSPTFQWVSNKNFTYEANQGEAAPIIEGKLYGGIPYVNAASGNLYRVLDQYNAASGVWDLTSFVENKSYFGTACSGTTGWGWARVINSAVCKWTADLNVSHGLVRVGPYTYDDSIARYGSGDAPKTADICKQNGQQTMFASYAEVLPGDCLVKSGHVRMVKEAPVVVYTASGAIDGANSYVIQCEQGLFVDGDWHDRVSETGIEYKIQGNDRKKSTFSELYVNGYLPHTFKEFLGADPVEPAAVAFGNDPGDTVSADEFMALKLTANYPVSDVFTDIVAPDGTVLVHNVKYANNHFTFSFNADGFASSAQLRTYQAAGNNTIRVTCRLGTGETLVAYSGILTE